MALIRPNKTRIGVNGIHSLVCIIVLLCLQQSNLIAQQSDSIKILSFYDTSSQLLVGKYAYFLEDDKNQYTFNQIHKGPISSKFKLYKDDVPNFANTTSTIWCRLTIANHASKACLLEIEKVVIHELEIFIPDENGNYQSSEAGTLKPMSYRQIKDNFFLFNIIGPKQPTPTTIYLRFKSDEVLDLPMSVGTIEQFFTKNRYQEIIFGIFFGIMFSMLLYNFFLYVFIRERAYIYYVIYILASILFNDEMVIGMGFEFVWPNLPFINFYNNIITAFMALAMILFTVRFLQTKKHTPLLHKGFILFYVITAAVVILNLAGYYFLSSVVVQIEFFFLCLYFTYVGGVALYKKVQIAGYYLFAWFFFLSSIVISILFSNGLLPANTFTKNVTLIGSAAEALFFSLALGQRINILRKQNEAADRERIQLIQRHAAELENQVIERTQEIAAQNEEMLAQNEELITQQDQIIEQHNQLQEVKILIEKKNEELRRYSEKLEIEVAKRTSELLNSNSELIEQNHQLEQYAFITAHNLRSPVARILGLVNVINTLDPAGGEVKGMLTLIEQTTKSLDNILHDLNDILEVKKGSLINFEKVNLQEKLAKVLDNLKTGIGETNAIIHTDFTQWNTIYSSSPYIESILYNLLSNALKYRDPERQLEISIKTRIESHFHVLEIKDNGLGMELSLYGHKVFGLYQRFHNHVEGKGLGLHLVKTQVEALAGTIELESAQNEGTTFIIYFTNANEREMNEENPI